MEEKNRNWPSSRGKRESFGSLVSIANMIQVIYDSHMRLGFTLGVEEDLGSRILGSTPELLLLKAQGPVYI